MQPLVWHLWHNINEERWNARSQVIDRLVPNISAIPSPNSQLPNPTPLCKPPYTDRREMAVPCTSITDERLADLLEDIFLRLPAPADLVRASAACVPFRQIATGSSFLRRFRKANPAPFIGFMELDGFRPAELPHTSAPIAAPSPSRRTSLSPSSLAPAATRRYQTPAADPGGWCVRSIRDDRVLLDRGPKRVSGSVVFLELVVCDPLHRRYHLPPPIPEDLAASVRDPFDLPYQYPRRCEVILVPPGKEVQEDKEEYETSFRVIWMAQCKTKLVAFVYSSTTGQWQSIQSKTWSDLLACGMPTRSLKYNMFDGISHYAYGCLYWSLGYGTPEDYPREVMLVLDTMTMEFSVADCPPGRWRGLQVGIVEAGEGRLGLLTCLNNADTSKLSYMVRQNTDGVNNEWQLEKIIQLGADIHCIVGSTERYLLLIRADNLFEEALSLDVKTFQLERVCELSAQTTRSIYTSFPTSLSSRTV
uniref:F-box domain-containing protein n=1 Tax=Aegilops tauschii TaxID=37682 RepID=M8C9Q2_AEGTA